MSEGKGDCQAIISYPKLPGGNSLAVAILLGAAVAEEAAVLAVGHVAVAVADAGADGAAAGPVNQAAGVAVVPVLVHKHPAQSRMLEICISLENTSHTQNGSTPSAS